MDRLLLSLFLFLTLPVVLAGIPSKVITVYGVENGMGLKVRDRVGFKYQLQIGAFKDHANAIKCKNRFQNKTAIAIQIIPPKRINGSYLVILGPLQNSLAIRDISKQLTGKSSSFAAIKAPSVANKSRAANKIKSGRKYAAVANQAELEQIAFAAINEISENKTLPIKPEISSQHVPEMQTKQMTEVLESAQNSEKENETLTIKALNQESVNNDLKLKMATDPAQIVALQKRQVEISQELERNVTKVIARIKTASGADSLPVS
jgi:hypothetical protein